MKMDDVQATANVIPGCMVSSNEQGETGRGLIGIGIPDLIVAQNAKQNHCKIYSLDSHYKP
jgi:hypothetical protein